MLVSLPLLITCQKDVLLVTAGPRFWIMGLNCSPRCSHQSACLSPAPTRAAHEAAELRHWGLALTPSAELKRAAASLSEDRED